MQPPPTAADLLAAVAEVLNDEIVPALQGPAQHHARVAASLVGIVERELRLGPDADDAERRALATLLGTTDGDATTSDAPAVGGLDLTELRQILAGRLRAGLADDPDVASRVLDVLFDTVRADLAIAKPGHAEWEGD